MKKSYRTRLIQQLALLITIVAIASATHAQQTQEIATGTVIDKVVSANDPTKSYAVYLPSSYTASKKYPVLYCFDPSARGSVPVTRFKDAAEKYNYIVIGSNNSRNGPNQPIDQIVINMWDDSHTRFSIDDRRAYVAGFSGGARVAISVAFWLNGRVVGAIACGAGFPVKIPYTQSRPFVLFATAGTEDFNNPEVQSMAKALDNSDPLTQLAIFEGGHQWLPTNLAQEAIEWFEIQAMKSGLREKDQSLVDKLFDQRLAQARTAEEAKDLYSAYQLYAASARSFASLHDTNEVKKKADELSTSKPVKDAAKREKEMAEQQNRQVQKIHLLIADIERSGDNFEQLAAFRNEMVFQRETANAAQSSPNRTVARRSIESLFVEFFEMGNAALFEKSYDRAVRYYTICTELQPDNSRVLVFMARAHALNGDKQKALSTLQNAANKGLANVQDLGHNDFAALQNEKKFKDISELVKKNQTERESKR
jgi:hypothetical protein